MQIDFTKPIVDFRGQPLKVPDGIGENGPKVRDATLADVCLEALMAPMEREPAQEKVRAYVLASRIFKNEASDISAEDIALLKQRVGFVCTQPAVVAVALDLLEQRQPLTVAA